MERYKYSKQYLEDYILFEFTSLVFTRFLAYKLIEFDANMLKKPKGIDLKNLFFYFANVEELMDAVEFIDGNVDILVDKTNNETKYTIRYESR